MTSFQRMDPRGCRGYVPHPAKSQVAICFFRNTGADPIGPVKSKTFENKIVNIFLPNN